MWRRASWQYALLFSLLVVVHSGGCVTQGDIRSRGLEDPSARRYGWWVGPRGNDSAAIDIGFSGNGLQIEVVRSYLSRDRLDSPVGKRWTHNYLMHIQNAPDKRIKLFSADGSTAIFTRTGPGVLTAQEDDARILKKTGDGRHSLSDENGTVYSFNRRGRLVKIKGHQYGNTISVAYGADGYLESISDAEGRTITFTYDPDTHRLKSIRDGRGRLASYEHDDIGNLTSVTNTDGVTSEYSYDRQSHLVGVTFP